MEVTDHDGVARFFRQGSLQLRVPPQRQADLRLRHHIPARPDRRARRSAGPVRRRIDRPARTRPAALVPEPARHRHARTRCLRPVGARRQAIADHRFLYRLGRARGRTHGGRVQRLPGRSGGRLAAQRDRRVPGDSDHSPAGGAVILRQVPDHPRAGPDPGRIRLAVPGPHLPLAGAQPAQA